MYRLIPCRHGICASPSKAVTRTLRGNKSTKDIEGIVLLPGGIERDILVQDESIIFSPRISLDKDDIKNLDCSNSDNFSFTHYGPDSQDKPTNQDFALSGHFTGRPDVVARFSILADGISNGFAFSQRGAQLSCFAAYYCLKTFYEKFAGEDRCLNEKNIEEFRSNLTSRINQFFEWDRDHLLHLFEADHREPSHIDPGIWRRYFEKEPGKWYGNTILISFLSSFGGFVVYAGDGRVILLKGEKSPKEIIRSSESSALDRFATMGVTPTAFRGALIVCDRGSGFVEIISVTDGIDRTWRTNKMDLAKEFSAEANLEDLMHKITNLQHQNLGDIDVDNYSIGRVFLLLSGEPHSRMIGSAEPAQVVETLPGSTPDDLAFTGSKPPIEEPQIDPIVSKKTPVVTDTNDFVNDAKETERGSSLNTKIGENREAAASNNANTSRRRITGKNARRRSSDRAITISCRSFAKRRILCKKVINDLSKRDKRLKNFWSKTKQKIINRVMEIADNAVTLGHTVDLQFLEDKIREELRHSQNGKR